MAKREQIVKAAAVEEQAVEETVSSNAQSQAEYEKLVEEVRGLLSEG